jgi:two-component system sensor histidine kinase UhpB
VADLEWINVPTRPRTAPADDPFPSMFRALPKAARLPALCLAVAAGILLFQLVGFTHWGIGAWVPFMAIWMLPKRHWWALVLTQIATSLIYGMLISHATGDGDNAFLGFSPGPVQLFLGSFVHPFTNLIGPWLMLRAGIRARDAVSARTLAWLHVAAMANFALPAFKDVIYVLYEGRIGDVRGYIRGFYSALGNADDWARLGEFYISHLMGGFVGLMVSVPLVLWWLQRKTLQGNGMILRHAAFSLLPIMTLYVGLSLAAKGLSLAELLRLLLMVAVIVFAVKHGWRGAAISAFATSCAVAIEEHLGGFSRNPIWVQLFIAIVGAVALMFGSALEELRKKNTDLLRMRDDLIDLARRLQSSATRTVQSEERERRRLASELHDEFGQTLVALATQLQQVSPLLQATGGQAYVIALADTAKALRKHLVSTLESLRPAALDELGLYGAIENGALRDLAERAGLDYHVELAGDGRLWLQLEDATRVAAYRVVQGAVTNTIRHARASSCRVRLRLEARHTELCLLVTVDDDGIGRVEQMTHNHGLRGLEDRMVAMGGVLRLRNLEPGIRVHALLRQSV